MIQGAVIADTGDEQLHMVSLGSTYCLTGRSVSAAFQKYTYAWGTASYYPFSDLPGEYLSNLVG